MKNFFKRYLPARHEIQKHPHMRLFGDHLHDPDIWHLTRRSVAGGIATGLFCAFIPLPVHIIAAAIIAIVLRVNLPLAIVFTLVSNPITFAPLYILAYKIGAGILNITEHKAVLDNIASEFSIRWFTNTLALIWEPLLLGCFLLGSISAILGYVLVRLLWRLTSLHKWGKRRAVMSKRNNSQ
ncbi:MAG: hypothetical protein A2W28_08155 [Gammaproteobacteria bacterium RBG_16_51_14]|nr:MAG: hypothetical protein A2W28_08155 [Gammaproteobacteria bacterium RBG_16_51_14]